MKFFVVQMGELTHSGDGKLRLGEDGSKGAGRRDGKRGLEDMSRVLRVKKSKRVRRPGLREIMVWNLH